jgi:hypothetical protein
MTEVPPLPRFDWPSLTDKQNLHELRFCRQSNGRFNQMQVEICRTVAADSINASANKRIEERKTKIPALQRNLGSRRVCASN